MQIQPVSEHENPILHLRQENEKLAQINVELREKNAFLEYELANLKRMIFGQSRERFMPTDNGQLSLFHQEARQAEVEKEQIHYTRQKAQGKARRLELPAHLPRHTETIEPAGLPEDAKKIGEAITEILEYKPGKLYVQRYVRPKYVLSAEDDQESGKIVIAGLPTLPIEQGNAGPGLLAHLLISKFVDHLPFYRQVQQFKREGVTISESTISGWFTASCKLLEPLYDVLRAQTQQATYLHADETPIPVQGSDKQGATHTGYHWVYRASEERLVCFDYRKGRGREGPDAFLKTFRGALQTDGYAAYEHFDKRPDVTLLACWAHARRYFEKAQHTDPARASQMLTFIQQLYAVERQAREEGLSCEARFLRRQEKTIPLLKQIEEWLRVAIQEALPRSAMGEAVAYCLRLWPRLIRYTENGHWEIDNNSVENSIRPVALGRKNYLFAGSHQAAHYAAMMYSFLGTCKMNEVEPYEWLRSTLTKIKDCKTSSLYQLLPVKQ